MSVWNWKIHCSMLWKKWYTNCWNDSIFSFLITQIQYCKFVKLLKLKFHDFATITSQISYFPQLNGGFYFTIRMETSRQNSNVFRNEFKIFTIKQGKVIVAVITALYEKIEVLWGMHTGNLYHAYILRKEFLCIKRLLISAIQYWFVKNFMNFFFQTVNFKFKMMLKISPNDCYWC